MPEYTDLRHAQDVIRQDPGVTSLGVTRLLTGRGAGDERAYKAGDEALVESGQAEWVVAPVHTPAAGRRLDADAERETAPLDGVETYPPAEPTVGSRRSAARKEGSVKAESDTGLGENLVKARAEAARGQAAVKGDAKLQASLGGRSARSGPVTSASELPADQPVPEEKQSK